MNTKLTQDHKDKISKSLRGRKLSLNHRINLANAKIGIALTQVHREKISQSLMGRNKGRKASWESRQRMSAAQIKVGAGWDRILDKEAAKKKLRKSHLGVPLTGRVAKDCLNHPRAKWWKIKSPNGLIYEFANMDSWARRNAHLITDSASDSKIPLHRRFHQGMTKQVCTSCTHWRGWVLISVTDQF